MKTMPDSVPPCALRISDNAHDEKLGKKTGLRQPEKKIITNYTDMKQKQRFTSPRVLQTLEVALESDLLQGPSSLDSVYTTGQEKNYLQQGTDYDTYFE